MQDRCERIVNVLGLTTFDCSLVAYRDNCRVILEILVLVKAESLWKAC